MSETVFPPCPNWFLPRVMSCNWQDTIAYGSRSNVIVCRHKPDMSLSDSVTVSIINNAHKERVTMVLLSTASADRGNFPDAVVSSAEDSVIKLWDVYSHSLVLELTAHVGHMLVAVDWSRADPDLLVSVDKQGLVVFWNLHSNTVHKLTFRKLNATCLACSPHQPDIVAFGTQSGLVVILSSKERGQMVHRMRGHDEMVCALAWCPVNYNVFDPNKSKEALLASGCKARQVFLWRTHTDGRMHAQLSLPPHPFAGNSKFPGGGGTSSFYLCLLWPEPTTLVTNALFGELLAWDLSRLENKEKDKTTETNMFPRGKKGGWPSYVRLLHNFHPRAAHAIATQPYKNCDHSEENGEKEESKDGSEFSAQPRLLWTSSQDRYLVACNLSTGKMVTKIPTFSSSVFSIAASPLDPSRIGIGVGDAAIRVWNLNNTAEFEVSCYWQRIKTKVLSLSWHPLKEDVLAFATGEGRVGLLTVTGGKQPVIFKMQHRGSVYSMCWGPFSYGKDNVPDKIPEVALYTCGNGEIFQFDPSSPDECSLYPTEMMKQVSVDKKMVQGSELSWKSDNSVFAVGLSDGSVHVFSSPHLLLLHSVHSIKKYIQMFAWHPESTATDSGFSPYCNWLAVAANEKSIRVFNFTPVIESLQGEGSGLPSTVVVDCCAVLNGHEDKVPCICWNPHISGQLVSVSYDSTAQVWDVVSQTALVVFTGHDSSVFSCLWSPLDPDVIFTGAADATLHAWRVSRQSYQSVHQLVAQRKSALKRLKRSNECIEKQLHEQELAEVVEPLPSTTDQQQAQAVESKRTKSKSLLSTLKIVEDEKMEQYLDACGALLQHSGEESISCQEHEETFPLFTLYSDRESVCRLLDREAIAGKDSPAITESMQHYELWKGSIVDLLKTAAREKRLSALLVSLAPLASPRLWLEMCKAYADQLAEAGHVQKAASYLIACHRLEEAIALLADRDRFTDALVLAKCRGADPALVSGILRRWADKLVLSGKLEQAAERLLVVGDLDGACQLYARSRHMASHRFAALVAKKAGLVDKSLSIAREALAEYLLHEKWDVADSIIAEHPPLKPLAVLRWMQHHVLSQVAGGAPLQWLCGTHSSPPPSLLHQLEACATEHAISKEQLRLALSSTHTSTCPRDAGGQMWLEVSRGLCLAWTTTTDQHALPHLLKVVDTVYQMQLHCSCPPHLLLMLCSWLAPLGPLADNSVFVSASHPPACGPLVQSLRAYLCAAIVFWLEGLLQEGRPADPDKLKAVSSEPVTDKPCVDASGVIDVEVNDCEREPNGEMSTGNAECSWFDVCPILTELVEDVVNAETICYFKMELQIKKLTASLASVVAGGTMLQGGGDGTSVRDLIPGEQGDIVAGQEDAGSGDLPPAKVPVDSSEGAEVVELVSTAECVEDGVGAEKDKEASAVKCVVQSDTGAVLLKLEQLKKSKETFETERVCVPNPYFLWFKLQNVCETVLAKHEPQGASCLHSQLTVLRSTYLD